MFCYDLSQSPTVFVISFKRFKNRWSSYLAFQSQFDPILLAIVISKCWFSFRS